jgi:excinuclease ABC subunit C
MSSASQAENYTKAAAVRDQLRALNQLLTTPVLAEEYLVNPNLVDDQRQLALTSLHELLHPFFPNLTNLTRIETYDIAHLSGTSATGSMVVAQSGLPNPDLYRHFKIKHAKSDSDVAMLAEILSRRFQNPSWPTPDLVVLDGGLPQLTSVPHTVPTIALAKHHETLVVPTPNGHQELTLDLSHPGLRLLMHLRNEAHRFSRRLHHRLRGKIIS